MTAIAESLSRAVRFLESAQAQSGELPVYASNDPSLRDHATLDPSIFPSALAAWSLSFCAAAKGVRGRLCDFLEAEMLPHGLWRHWPRSHAHHASLPPDLDDTGCAALAMGRAGRMLPDHRHLLLANRNRAGLFYTWLSPRLRWSGWAHMTATAGQLAHAPTLFLFFRATSAKPRDVDAVVNANALFHVGRFDGDEAVIAYLTMILRQGRERHCDKWYDEPSVIWYFLARALAERSDEARALLLAKLTQARPDHALHRALRICAMRSLGAPVPDDDVARLMAGQAADGSWPRAALYHGGRTRRRDGSFDAPHPDTPRWGSEALTTAFAVEALARCEEGAG